MRHLIQTSSSWRRPTGLSLACQLIRYGIDFVVWKRTRQSRVSRKRSAFQARTLENLTTRSDSLNRDRTRHDCESRETDRRRRSSRAK
jgi:hypothetical protein